MSRSNCLSKDMLSIAIKNPSVSRLLSLIARSRGVKVEDISPLLYGQSRIYGHIMVADYGSSLRLRLGSGQAERLGERSSPLALARCIIATTHQSAYFMTGTVVVRQTASFLVSASVPLVLG